MGFNLSFTLRTHQKNSKSKSVDLNLYFKAGIDEESTRSYPKMALYWWSILMMNGGGGSSTNMLMKFEK